MEKELSFDQQQVQQMEDAMQVYEEAVASDNELQREMPEESRSMEEILLELDNYIAILESRRTIESILYNDKEGASTRYNETIRSLKAFRDSLAEKYEKVRELKAKNQKLQAELQKYMEETGVTGGCIVCIYEEGLPRQKFEIGDILYAVDGQMVYTVEDYESMKNSGDAVVSVLRFQDDNNFVTTEIQYDSSCGKIGLLPLNETVS